MKHLLLLIFFLQLIFNNSLIAQNDSLKNTKYYSQSGNFKINFPGIPVESQFGQHTLIGDIYSYTFIFQDTGRAVYYVIYSEYPNGLKPDTSAFLESIKKGYLGSLTILKEENKKIKLNGYNGLYYKANSSDLYVVKTDYWINQRLYQVYIERTDRYPTEKEVTEFINSFELVK